MREIYRATDTKLDRDIAVKVLPPAFTGGAGRPARFEREAKLLADALGAPVVDLAGRTHAVAPDGARFLVREPLTEAEASPITLLTDGSSLVKERC